MHPVAAGRIDADVNIKVYAANFLQKVVANKAKSELAHRLTVKLTSDAEAKDNFKVPTYIQSAIKYAVKGE